MSAKRYTEEFKIEAVKQVTERGHRLADVAARLAVTTYSMYAWMKPAACLSRSAWRTRVSVLQFRLEPS